MSNIYPYHLSRSFEASSQTLLILPSLFLFFTIQYALVLYQFKVWQREISELNRCPWPLIHHVPTPGNMAPTLSLFLASALTLFSSLTTDLPQHEIRAIPPPVFLLAGGLHDPQRLRFTLPKPSLLPLTQILTMSQAGATASSTRL